MTATQDSAIGRTYSRGYVRRPDKDQIIANSHRRLGAKLRQMRTPAVPDFDWNALGKMPPVLDQGQCGSCWDFSGVECATMAMIVAGLWPADGSMYFSPQYILDCTSNGGCNGDDNVTVLAELKANGGPTTADYGPYYGSAQSCKYHAGTPKYKIVDWGFADGSGGQGVTPTAAIKAALVTYGPLGTGVDASNFDSYTSGVMTGSGNNIDHDVIIYGWHDDPAMPEGGYWLVRNSWGTSWGEGGNCRMAYGAYSIGTEAVFAVADTSPVPTPTPGPAPGPTPPSPTPLPPTVGTIAATGTDGRRQFSITGTVTTPVVSDPHAVPTWLIILLQLACTMATTLPAPWSTIFAALCGSIKDIQAQQDN